MRNEAGIAERLVWRLLSDRKLADRKFRRQHSIGPYLADFACCIEVMNGKGWRMVRIWTNEVAINIDDVLTEILTHLTLTLSLHEDVGGEGT